MAIWVPHMRTANALANHICTAWAWAWATVPKYHVLAHMVICVPYMRAAKARARAWATVPIYNVLAHMVICVPFMRAAKALAISFFRRLEWKRTCVWILRYLSFFLKTKMPERFCVIKKSILLYHKIVMILWYHKFYFVISQNRICDIKISSLFVISQNRFFDITNSIYWYHKIDLVILKIPMI